MKINWDTTVLHYTG